MPEDDDIPYLSTHQMTVLASFLEVVDKARRLCSVAAVNAAIDHFKARFNEPQLNDEGEQ